MVEFANTLVGAGAVQSNAPPVAGRCIGGIAIGIIRDNEKEIFLLREQAISSLLYHHILLADLDNLKEKNVATNSFRIDKRI